MFIKIQLCVSATLREINKNYEFVINEIKKLDENYLIKNYNGILSEIQKVDLSNRTLKSKNILLPYGNK